MITYVILSQVQDAPIGYIDSEHPPTTLHMIDYLASTFAMTFDEFVASNPTLSLGCAPLH